MHCAPETVIPGEAKKDKPEKDQKRKAEEAPEPVSTPEPEPEPTVTLGEKNALGSAESYIDMSGFSREGLIKQLKFEGFSKSLDLEHLGVRQSPFATFIDYRVV